MRSVRQKYISLILILSMFFLGMCCGSTQADSSLMYGILHHTDSVFVNSGVDELPEQLSNDTTERMLSANAYLRQEGRRINTRTNRAVNCLFLIVELLSQLFPVIFACSVLSQTYHAPGNHVIVRYIHKKDGKKNNETIYFLLIYRIFYPRSYFGTQKSHLQDICAPNAQVSERYDSYG